MTASNSRRLPAVDGLRGLAALVVLVHHSMLTIAPLSSVYYGADPREVTTLVGVLAFTPLHLTWVGLEAVLVFFVISGYVLAGWVAVNRPRSVRDWWGYARERFVRLYFPVWGAVVLGLLLVALRPAAGDPSEWMTRRPTDWSVVGVARDMTLLTGESGVIGPLWSLTWELWFSLTLPVFVAVMWRRIPPLPLGIVLLGLSGVGVWIGWEAMSLMPAFALGVLLRRCRIDGSRRTAWVPLAAGALLSVQWWARPLGADAPAALVDRGTVVDAATFVGLLVGAMLLVWYAVQQSAGRSWLSTSLMQWLGSVSFSLYLTHEPVVLLVASSVESRWLTVPTGMVVALLLATAFHKWCEAPAHRFAKRARSRVPEPSAG